MSIRIQIRNIPFSIRTLRSDGYPFHFHPCSLALNMGVSSKLFHDTTYLPLCTAPLLSLTGGKWKGVCTKFTLQFIHHSVVWSLISVAVRCSSGYFPKSALCAFPKFVEKNTYMQITDNYVYTQILWKQLTMSMSELH